MNSKIYFKKIEKNELTSIKRELKTYFVPIAKTLNSEIISQFYRVHDRQFFITSDIKFFVILMQFKRSLMFQKNSERCVSHF